MLVELNGTTARAAQGTGSNEEHHALRQPLSGDGEMRTRRQAHSGGPASFWAIETAGTELAVAPELLLSWGPVMTKSGIKIPFFDTFDSPGAVPDYRINTDLIVQV